MRIRFAPNVNIQRLLNPLLNGGKTHVNERKLTSGLNGTGLCLKGNEQT